MVPFGDIILPFVGVVSLGLLLVATRLFFMNGLTPSPSLASPQPIPSVPDVVLEDAPLDVAVPSATEAPADKPLAAKDTAKETVLAVEVTATPAEPDPPFSLEFEADGMLAEPETPDTPEPAPAKPAPQTKPKQESVKPASKPAGPSWRVQVGAYGSKRAAEDIVRKLAKSGYTATVFSGPKYHKVWVQAGSTKAAAEKTAAKLKTLGYSGSYVVPPPAK